MRIKEISIENYRAIKDAVSVHFGNFNCVVGKNDAGKSTVLKAINMFLNDIAPTADDCNLYSGTKEISVIMKFEIDDLTIDIDGGIETDFITEELVDENGYLNIKKQWDTSQKTIRPTLYIKRKTYKDSDFFALEEKSLIKLCKEKDIETQKGNGEQYNNKEKREKLREKYHVKRIESEYRYESLPTTGQTRLKKLCDVIKTVLPRFEYFRADTSLSDSDNSVQKYFKEKAVNIIRDNVDTSDIEKHVKAKISESLSKITEKINRVLPEQEKVEAKIDFDWSKLITTSFKCSKEDSSIPLSSRGDGFRRITMMSYFEMLSEESDEKKSKIYGFEEPETFLHPELQRQLSNSLIETSNSGYQVFITTHSPILVSEINREDIIHVSRNESNGYQLKQSEEVDLKTIIEDLGIKGNESIFSLYSDTNCLFLVEGPDDVKAMHHLSEEYKVAGKIDKSFEDLRVTIIPVGGCSSIIHWRNFQIIQKLGKPYVILLDSDKENAEMESPNLNKLVKLGYSPTDCFVTKKREIENYIPASYLSHINANCNNIAYGDWDDVKKICKNHHENIVLGGKKVCEYHFKNLTFEQLRSTFCPNGNDNDDEFLIIYNAIKQRIH